MLANNERKKHRIDLINIIPRQYAQNREALSPPNGILYVGGALKSAGYRVNVHHISDAQIDEAALLIARNQPLFVGVSVFTGLPTYVSAEFSKKVKEINKNLTVVWGGIHPSLIPEQCVRQRYIDIVVVGEGEDTVTELADALVEGTGLRGIKGIGYKEGNVVCMNEPRPLIEDLDRFRIDWSLIEPDRYLQKGPDGIRSFVFITSRGCPSNCGFCYNLQFNKHRWRAHSIEFVLKEVRELKEKLDINQLSFNDDNFFAKKDRAIKLIEGFRAMNISMGMLELRVDDIEEELVRVLKDFDVERVFTGWESGSDRILKLIHKDFGVEDIIKAVSVLARYPKMHLKTSAIIGFPTETRQEILSTVSTMLTLGGIHSNMAFNMGMYLPYPGTPLYPLAIKEGFRPPESPEDWKQWDMFGSKLPITWLPRFTKRDIANVKNINRYCQIYETKYQRAKGESRLKYFVRDFFRRVARYRYEKNFFHVQFEFPLLRLLRAINRCIEYRN